MPRRSGGGGGGMRRSGFSSPPRQPSYSTQPAARPSPPPPAPSSGGGGGLMSGLGGMVMQGMALGTGSAMGHRAVDAVLGSRHPEPAQAQQAAVQLAQAPEEPCNKVAKTFADCMGDQNGDLEACRYYFDSLQTCRQTQLHA